MHIHALDVFQSRSRYMGQQLKGKRYEWDEKQMDNVKVSEYGVQHAAKLLLWRTKVISNVRIFMDTGYEGVALLDLHMQKRWLAL
jgi:hypothetical protein